VDSGKEARERKRLNNLYIYENDLAIYGLRLVAGVDEAGRGPLAGPLLVAAVILPGEVYIPGLNDSKQLTPSRRAAIYAAVKAVAVAVATCVVDVDLIDRLNIYQATVYGMREAVRKLAVPPDAVLIDAVPVDGLPVPIFPLVKGDTLSASIAAASVVAKVERDRLMEAMDSTYPGYGFKIHKGYPTPSHLAALERLGPCPIHRKSFAPVKACWANRAGVAGDA